jgi:plastocyanin/mono/diheme cytochrome c family protein
MNTSKQVNVMIGLLMIGTIATFLYFMWDNVRDTAAQDRQLRENAERGGRLFSLNCRSCHGLTGLGAAENGSLPGAALNVEDPNRIANGARRAYLRETIRCGRVGTSMPPWSIEQGGPLNDFQIEQLVALITGGMAGFDQDPEASLAGWEHAIEEANHADEFTPAKHLEEAVGASDTTFALNNARGLKPGQTLRIDDEPDDGEYEIVQVIDAPAGSLLAADAGKDDTELSLQEAAIFEPGDIIIIEKELLEVIAAPAQNNLAEDVSASVTELALVDAAGFEAEEVVKVGLEKMRIISVAGDTLRVERAYDGSKAAEHPAESLATEVGVQDDLAGDIGADDVSIELIDSGGFAEGQVIKIDGEKLRIVLVSGDTLEVERGFDGTKADEHEKDTSVLQQINVIEVERGVDGTDARKHKVKKEVFEVGTEVEVERGFFKTEAAEHEADAHVFNGPIIPPDSITGSGEGNPPCGQSRFVQRDIVAEIVEITGTVDVSMQDNVFDIDGKQNPTLKAASGATVTFNIANEGSAAHNLRIAGPDGEYDTEDDIVSDPDLITGGNGGTLQFTAVSTGTFDYRCDFHAAQMLGKITVE